VKEREEANSGPVARLEDTMKHLKSKWTVIIALLTAIVLFAAFSFGHGTAAQYVTAKVEQGDIRDVVQATGTINAVTTVQVGSQVSGTISKLSADFNSPVKKDQVIAEIDPSLFQGAVLQAKADLENARANVAAAQANLEKAKATVAQTKSDYVRTVDLTKEGVMSQQQLDVSQANNDSAIAAVNAAQATLEQGIAQVSQKAAALQVAETNLNNTIIRSPINGVVTNRTVEVGQTVAASLQAPNLFNIAQDLSKMQVDVSTDESDVGQIKVGQDVTFKVDAFPDDTFRGKVVQVRMNPTTVQNVVTYDTVVAFNNPGDQLFPGMTAYVSIPVAEAGNVVKVPNAALRFSPGASQDQKALTHKSGTSPNPGSKADTVVLWKLEAGNRLEPVQVKTGITDHTYTEIAQVLSGALNPGDQLITGTLNSAPKPASGSAPGMNAGRMGAGRIGH
jgi:HlyD family secretion protein